MKLLKIVALFLGCRLAWIWFDRCGPELGLGETLPFCNECSGIVTIMRLLFLGLAIWIITRLLESEPEYMQLYDNDMPPAHSYRIHWQRVALLVAIVTYPLWVWWVDINTLIPDPSDIWLTRSSCRYAGVKGTMLWGIVLTFVVWGFRLLHKS